MLLLTPWAVLSHCVAQSPMAGAGQSDRALAFLEECVDYISQFALETAPDHVIVRESLVLLVESLGTQFADAKPALAGRNRIDAIFLFDKAITDLASRPGQRLDRFALVETAVRLYLASLDAYSLYRSASEVDRFKEAVAAPASGIGMNMMEEAGGLFCFPFPDSSAELAGIPMGGRLLMVDGHKVEGRSIFELASMIRGLAGTTVSLRVEQTFGRSTLHQALRESIDSPMVRVDEQFGDRVLVKLRNFNRRAYDELQALAEMRKDFSTMALDLRSCQGGELEFAVQIADLFLPEGTPIGAAAGPQRNDQYTAKDPVSISPRNLVLLHNKGTASAAEFLIGALMCNRSPQFRVNMQGETTYGKGVAQEHKPMSNGGRIELTTVRLFMPNGKTWDEKGLNQASFD